MKMATNKRKKVSHNFCVVWLPDGTMSEFIMAMNVVICWPVVVLQIKHILEHEYIKKSEEKVASWWFFGWEVSQSKCCKVTV